MSEEPLPRQESSEISGLLEFTAGQQVLRDPEIRAFTRGSVEVLGTIIDGEAITLLPLAAELAVGGEAGPVSDTPATDALQAIGYIRGVVARLDPRPTDKSRGKIRHELDWGAVQRVVDRRFAEDAAAHADDEDWTSLERQTTDWFLYGDGRTMVETCYLPDGPRDMVIYGAPGGRQSPINRQVLLLASLAGAAFRESHGLVTADRITLEGEDGQSAGWLGDASFQAQLRAEARRRIAAGEIAPTILFGGSGDDKRILRPAKPDATEPGELEIVQGYLVPGVALMYPEKGVVEADAMLAAALRIWDGDVTTLAMQDLPTGEGQYPAKLVTFRSSLGVTVTGIFTTGEEARIRGQLNRLADHDPGLFQGKDALAMGTTAIYRPSERPILLEFGLSRGLPVEAIHCLGHSAHAAGIKRGVPTLVGEQAKSLAALENIARRTAVISEGHMIGHVGGAVLDGALTTDER